MSRTFKKSIAFFLALVMMLTFIPPVALFASANVTAGTSWMFNYRADTTADTNIPGWINITGAVVTSGTGGLQPATQSGVTADGVAWSAQAREDAGTNSRNRTGNTVPAADFTFGNVTISRHVGRSWITNVQLTLAVPNGTYNVGAIIGDLGGSWQGGMNINGTTFPVAGAGANNVALREFNNIVVTNGQLVIISDNNNGQVCAVVVTNVSLDAPRDPVFPASINVAPPAAELTVGATQQLTATVLPADADNKAVAWSSSNTAVATVSTTGLVTGVSAGEAVITATSAEVTTVTGTAAITVLPPQVAEFPPAVLALPIAEFDVYGTTMNRGVLIAVAANGVFMTWRFFPEEATGIADGSKSLTGNNFAIYKNGVRIALVTNSTNYTDPAGTVTDEYIIVTVNPAGEYISRTAIYKPAPRITTNISAGAATAGQINLPVQRPAANVGPANSGTGTSSRVYNMDQIAIGQVDESGYPAFLVKWETGSPDVISQGHNGPVIWDAYQMIRNADGTIGSKLLWRIDLGVNFRPGQHYGIGILHDFAGKGTADFMVKTAPGSRVMEVIDGVLTGNFTYVGQKFLGANPEVETRVTRWDGTRNWQATDDYRNYDGNTTAANRLRAGGGYSSFVTTVSMMSDLFMNWQTHPEVTSALHGANLELNEFENRKCSKAGCEGHGWWMYPPQVMLGMFPANYPERESGASANAGKHWNSFLTNLANTANADVAQWTQAVWQRLKDLPTNPCDFKDVVITRQIADDLAIFWRVVSRDTNGGDRYTGSGHIADGPEFMTVFCGLTGKELDTIEYAVPRGTFRADGSYVPDVGLLWNDFTTNQPEPYNRVFRHHSGVGYLDGIGFNPSRVENRGQYSRFTLSRYDWDGENLTSEVITDSGFEVLPNPFANGVGNRGGMVAHSNTHGGPGRKEVTFNPNSPRDELRPAGVTGANLLRWLQQNGSITVQTNHQISFMDLTGDGKDNIIMGSLALNPDGSTLWAGYYARYQGSTVNLNYNAIEKVGHGDSHFLGYFHPSQQFPQYWSCLEGAFWDSALINARTGEVMHVDSPGTATAWSAGRDNGRASAGFFRTITGETGWQLHTRGANSSPRGTNAENGLRQWNGNASSQQSLSPGNSFQIFWRPNMTTSPTSNSISTINTTGSSFGTGNPGGLATSGTRVCGGTKDRPAYVGSVFGDYREQLVLGTTAATHIAIFFNTETSDQKLATMQADRRYRVELERQKSVYGQPVMPSYYWGPDLDMAVYFESIQLLLPDPDKTELAVVIEEAEDYKEADFTPASWAAFAAAFAHAQAVFANPSATQAAIDAAILALNAAIAGLTEVPPPLPPLPQIPRRADLRNAGWNEITGTDFEPTGVWSFTASGGASVTRMTTDAGTAQNSTAWLRFEGSGTGGRSANRILPTEVSAGEMYVIFDWRVPTNVGSVNDMLNVAFRDGTHNVVALRLGREGSTATNWRLGIYSGDSPGATNTAASWLQTSVLPAPYQGSSLVGMGWLRVGIHLDVTAGLATVSIARRNADGSTGADLITRIIPFTGTKIDRVVFDGERSSGSTVNVVNMGIDNLWFFTAADAPYTVAEIVPYDFLPQLPANPGLLIQSWAKTVCASEVNSFADLGLPTSIEVITNEGKKETVNVTWAVHERPRGVAANAPFDPNRPGIWTLRGTMTNIPGVAVNTKQIPIPLIIDLRPAPVEHARTAEWLDRGVVAVPVASGHGTGMLVKWRILVTEYAEYGKDIAFNVYRNGVKVNANPIVGLQNFVDSAGVAGSRYKVELIQTGQMSDEVTGWSQNFMTLNLQRPATRTIAGTGSPSITYSPTDVAVGDVLGNGSYQFLVKWTPSRSQDPGLDAQITGETIFDLYTLEGEILWRINMGHNISSAQQHTHTRNFWDFTQTGRADFAIKTAIGTRVYHPKTDGTIDDLNDIPAAILHSVGNGTAVNTAPEWRTPTAPVHHQTGYQIFTGGFTGTLAVSGTPTGRVRSGPEYFTIFNGKTGMPIDTVNFFAPYSRPGNNWGDPGTSGTNNRSDRMGGTVAYLPKGGVPGAEPYPSAIEVRGHYGPHYVGAYQLINDKIVLVWDYSMGNPATNPTYGNHQMTAADVTGDGYDDIIFGSYVLNSYGQVLWAADGSRGTSRGTHGDSMHVSVMSPYTKDFWIMTPQEAASANSTRVYNAATGEDVLVNPVGADVGRGVAANLLPTPGFEIWSSNTALYNLLTGQRTHTGSNDRPSSQNFRIYWTGNLLSDLYDGQSNPSIRSFSVSGNSGTNTTVQTFSGTESNWGTKATPAITADIFGCWREDVIVRTTSNTSLRIYTTNIPTEYAIYTLMHDPVFRLQTNAQGNVYNQPNHLGFYLGADSHDQVKAFDLPIPNVRLIGEPEVIPVVNKDDLTAAIAAFDALIEANYTSASWAPAAAAATAAKAVLADAEATQEVVNAATFALNTAVAALVLRPTAAPAMPLNVNYTPVTAYSVTITWDAVPGADGYNIYRRDAKVAEATLLGTIASIGWVDFEVEAGTDYYYSVSAFNDAGESPRTREAFIMLANNDAIALSHFVGRTSHGHVVTGSRIRLGDLTGDGRTDVLFTNNTVQGNQSLNSAVTYLLVAYDIEGNFLWEFTLDPNWDGRPSGITGTSQDEPTQIVDLEGKGYNDVIAVMHPQKNRGTVYGGGVLVVICGRTGTIKTDVDGNQMRRPLAQLQVPGLSAATGSNATSTEQLSDCIVMADLDGRGVRQHVALKARYGLLTTFEVLDKEGRFVMNYLWRGANDVSAARAPGTGTGNIGRAGAGHYPLAIDLDGQGKDYIISAYQVFRPDGTLFWKVPHQLVWPDGTFARRANGNPIEADDHVDTIQAGDVIGNGELAIVFGGDGAGGSTFCYSWDGKLIWTNASANEPQSLNLGQFRTDSPGMLLYGLDRRWRDRDTHAGDGMFLVGANGENLFMEDNNYGGFGTIVIRVDNWTGSYSPLCASFGRNWNWEQAAEGVAGRANQILSPHCHCPPGEHIGAIDNGNGTKTLTCVCTSITGSGVNRICSVNRATVRLIGVSPGIDGRGYTNAPLVTDAGGRLLINENGHAFHVPGTGTAGNQLARGLGRGRNPDYDKHPALYDGYFNQLFEVTREDTRFMAMDMAGDARTEMVGFTDQGQIWVYYNNSHGDVRVNADGTLNEEDRLTALRSGVTGTPKPQTPFMSNYTRYPTDLFVPDIETRTPARVQLVSLEGETATLTWTPILGAESYTLYRNGVAVAENVRNIGFIDETILDGFAYSFTVVANQGGKSSPHSLPLVIGEDIIKVDKEDLEAAIAAFDALVETDFTPASWAPVAAVAAAAKVVYADEDATQEVVDAATDALNAAVATLVERANKAALAAAIAAFDALTETEYTPVTWAPAEAAATAAKAVYADANATQEAVDAATLALNNAMAALVERADKVALVAAITAFDALDEATFTPVSWAPAAAAAIAAKAVFADLNATQEAVNAATTTLNAAVAALVVRADLTALVALVEEALELDEDDYTVSSWAVLVTVIKAAQDIIEKAENAEKKEADDALEALEAAIDGLVSIVALAKAIEDVEALELDEDGYTIGSWMAFFAAFEAARAVLGNANATPEEVAAAIAALEEAYEALVWIQDLKDLYFDIEELELSAGSFTLSSWAAFIAAFEAAMAVIENPDATAEEVAEAMLALEEAFEALTAKVLVQSVPTAWVRVLSGNMNELFIVITEHFCNGTINVIEVSFMIRNNAEGVYGVGEYAVFVDTKGNDQIREIFIIEVETE